MLQPSSLFHGRYRVVRCIKSGGAGAVYEVQDEVTNRRRALKVMLPVTGSDTSLRKRFAQEARITGRVESDHVVQVSDAGIEDGSNVPFVVMDLLQGEEMGSLSARRGPLPPADVVLYLSQVALALEKTHAAGIVHRDLKPENLFVTARDDGSACVKILDFGAAKNVVHHAPAERTAVVGTPIYMAPEQIRGDGAIGPPTDIYALAHVAYTLLTGEPYWAPEGRFLLSVFTLFQKILAGHRDAASARAARRGVTLPPAFDAWFAAATALDPAERPSGAARAVLSMAEALGVAAPRALQRNSEPAPSRRSPLPPRPAAAPASAASPYAPTVDAASDGAPSRRPTARRPNADSDERDALLKDEATQVYTERYLKIQLEQEYILARKNRTRLAALVFEVERHAGAAKAREQAPPAPSLHALAHALRTYRPSGACLALHGKETLVLLVPGAGETRTRALATVLAQRVQERLAKDGARRRLGPRDRGEGHERDGLRERDGGRPRAAAAPKLRVGIAYLDRTDTSGREMLERALSAMRGESN